MPSGRAKRQLEPASLEFFLDRGLGRYDVAEMLRSHGHVAHVMADVYPTVPIRRWRTRTGCATSTIWAEWP
jgi:hypothetical protein